MNFRHLAAMVVPLCLRKFGSGGKRYFRHMDTRRRCSQGSDGGLRRRDLCHQYWLDQGRGEARTRRVGDRLVFKIAQKDGGWAGSGYDPQRDLNLSAKLRASGDKMVTTDCVLGGLVCRSTNWTRSTLNGVAAAAHCDDPQTQRTEAICGNKAGLVTVNPESIRGERYRRELI